MIHDDTFCPPERTLLAPPKSALDTLPLLPYTPLMDSAVVSTQPSQLPDTRDDYTRAELEAVADDAFGTDSPERRLWAFLHDPAYLRTNASGLVQLAGFPPHMPTRDAGMVIADVFGKMSDRGYARVRAFQVMTGFTPDKVASTLAKLMDSEDERTAARCAETASKCLGMQQQRGVQVNVQVNTFLQPPAADPIVQRILDED